MKLDDRMKRYEESSDLKLTPRMPVVIRLDGCHFHTFTRGFKKPFDLVLVKAMQDTLLDLCKSIENCVFGYTQSDEITLVLVDYGTLETDRWFDYRIEKLCSVSASKCTRFFNRNFVSSSVNFDYDSQDWINTHTKVYNTAEFDSRVFNVPKEDVTNCILWRQRDAEKNSVLSLAQSLYNQHEMQGLNTKKLQDKMFTEKGVNWNELETFLKRGTACYRDSENQWKLDLDMPIISQDRDYIDKHIMIG